MLQNNAAILDLERKGDFVLAYDAALRALAAQPGDAGLQYLAVRALARCGAAAQALALYRHYDLGRHDDSDILALRARLEKDLALRVAGAGRAARVAAAAKLYEDIYRRFGGHYPAVNAATLYLLAGEPVAAREFGRVTIAECDRDSSRADAAAEADPLAAYFREASRAEAMLVLGEIIPGMEALHRLARLSRDDLAARASTRRQLAAICDALRLNPSILDPLDPPRVLFFAGGDGGERERALASRIAAEIDRHRLGSAYGPLAALGDLLFAEAAVDRMIDLHLVLPTGRERTRAAFEARGDGFGARCESVLRHAASVTEIDDGAGDGIAGVAAYAARRAHGLAALRCRHIGAALVAIDLAAAPAAPDRRAEAQTLVATGPQRRLAAMLHAELVGYRGLGDAQLPAYHDAAITAFGTAIRTRGGDVLRADLAAGALSVVLAGAESAAACALDLAGAAQAVDAGAHGLDVPIALRIAGHFGPLFVGRDPFSDRPAFFGAQLSRAAAIEPVTPPGIAFVTEAFAAELALAPPGRAIAEYVGHVPLAGAAGLSRMYRLTTAET